jgi:hypothetical protein
MYLPKTVADRLQGKALPEHPDADLLTAFAEATLAGSERDRVVGHIAACAECRHVVALAMPELISEPGHVEAPRPRWLGAPVLRWGTLAACVVVVAAALLIHRGEQAKTEIAMRQNGVPSSAMERRRESIATAPARSAAPEVKTSESKSLRPGRSSREVASANPGQAVGANAAPHRSNGSPAALQKPESLDAQAAAPEPVSPRNADQQALAQNSAATAKAAPVFTPRPSAETAASTMGGAAKFTDFRAPSWRLSEDGLPERSFASGQWEKVQVDHKNGFRALAANGMEVWVGGEAGILYHSEDMGLNWTRMIAVTGTATLTDDITNITLSDHLHGKVTTSSGQTWVTSDAGKSWETQ